jgi:phosphatidylglycerol:prolipoprotein diacylglycerol transferase
VGGAAAAAGGARLAQALAREGGAVRPRLVEYLNALFGTSAFDTIVPQPPFVYALAMLAALFVVARRRRRAGLDGYHVAGAALWAMCGGVVGARLFFLAQHLGETLAHPARALDPAGGIASWGAYLGGFAGLALYCRLYGQELPRHADLLASALGLGVAVGRWACFLNGDDFGTLSGAAWAVSFPHGSYPFVAQVRAGLLSPLEDLSLPVHPVQLYLSLNGLAVFLLASRFYRRFAARPGATFCFYWLCYCTARFALECFRGDQDAHLVFGVLTVPQVLCLMTVPLAGYGLRRSLRGGERAPAEASARVTREGAAQVST